MADTPDTTDVYRATRERVTGLLEGCSEQQASGRVPACPSWTVKDVVAHLAGVSADILAGQLEGAGTDPWTEAQVDARRAQGLAEVLEEWAEAGPKVEALLGPGGAPTQLVFDEVTHEHDLRGALDAPGARGSEAVQIALDFVAPALGFSLPERGLAPLRLRGDDGREWVTGDGQPGATLAASSFELLRAASGRRSAEQIAALDWDTDPSPYLPAFTFGPFVPPDKPLEEG